ncbi:MAG: 4-(cytidine 5'-diphospho)-2-C-methyl-D-erythritol kinase [Clostridia bacterium]|nr:4-(cytidine 5'-diphospho)-2-C-methyl-D-erythritol kinase [Clostridia bacterium]
MADVVELASKAKINLTLAVTGRAENGYHLLDMVMQNVELADTVRVEKADALRVETNLYYLPADSRNIAYKMAERFFRETGVRGGAEICITKKIPVSAGLAGGSGNGAAVLKGLNRLYGTGLSLREMQELAFPVGSDIPFCLAGGAARVRGMGEKVERIKGLPPCTVLLVKPAFGISTEAAYRAFDENRPPETPDTEGMLDALRRNDLETVGALLSNQLEAVASACIPKSGR